MPNGHSARTTDRTARDTIAEAYGGPPFLDLQHRSEYRGGIVHPDSATCPAESMRKPGLRFDQRLSTSIPVPHVV